MRINDWRPPGNRLTARCTRWPPMRSWAAVGERERKAAQTRLETENTPKTAVHVSERLPANAAGELQQEIAVDGDDLRDIRHRVLRQARGVRGKQDVPWCVEQADVGGQHDANDGVQTTPIEGIVLYDQDGTMESRL